MDIVCLFGQVIFLVGQLKTENYWPTVQLDFKIFFLPSYFIYVKNVGISSRWHPLFVTKVTEVFFTSVFDIKIFVLYLFQFCGYVRQQEL